MMPDVVVVGAGLSGLTAAYQLFNQGLSVCVLESDGDVGGVIRTIHEDGYTIESGPNTFQSTGEAIVQLCRLLDLPLTETAVCAKTRYLFYQNRLHALPHDVFSFLTTPLLSPAGKLRLFSEPFQSATRDGATLSEFVARRLGGEILDRFVDPFVSGVYAGDADQLEVASVFPTLLKHEREAGSLFAGLLKSTSPRPKTPYRLLGLDAGMQGLPHALAEKLPQEAIRCNTRVLSIEKNEGGYHCLLASGEIISALGLILATPADVAAELLSSFLPTASAALDEIPYAPIATVHFGFEKNTIPHSLDGFGFLVPQSENMKLLGAIWASSLFPGRAPEGQALMSCFIGGARNPSVNQLPESEIVKQVLADLATVFGKDLSPTYRKVIVYHKAIPQYVLGHRQRVETITYALQQASGLALCGNYLSGVSLNDCVKSGFSAADKILESSIVRPYAEQTT